MRKIILGTDWWTDCDDIVALRVLTRAAKNKDIDLIGIIINACMDFSAASVDGFLTLDGLSGIPIGIDLEATDFEGNPSPYHEYLAPYATKYKTNTDAENAVKLYRRLLSESCEPVEIVEIGFLQAFVALLESEPDEYSPLYGKELVKENVPLAVGPTLTSASKFELRNKSWRTPGVLAAAGCQVSIITDSPVIPQEYLPICAGMAVQAGMDPFAALQAITINPAKHAGIADRVGSLEIGKDADIVITDGCPFEVSTTVKRVFIDGRQVAQA